MATILTTSGKLALAVLAMFVLPANAQSPLAPLEISVANQLLDDRARHNNLKCSFTQRKPALDFALHFVAGYLAECQASEFGWKEAPLSIFTRVTPEGKPPALFGETYHLPALPPEMRGHNKFFQFSGGFRIGEGSYLVEIVAKDNFNRLFRQSWKIKAARNGRHPSGQLLIEANTVQPLFSISDLDQPAQAPKGPRLTVMLDAAPMLSPLNATLQAWERAELLNSLWAMLGAVRYSSVRVVAFNFAQQKELFHQDHFNRAALVTLSQTLRDLQMATVSVQSLAHPLAPDLFLANLVNHDLAAAEPPDALIFMGPYTHVDSRFRAELLLQRANGMPRVFNFQYLPLRRPPADTIEFMTRALHDTTFKISNADEFGKAIQKMLLELNQK